MSENKISVLPEVIKPISDAVQENVPETIKQADGALSTVVGFFNNVVLYPVKKANMTFAYKLEAFEDDLKEKIKDVPEEHLQIPPTMIAGPALEALRYTYDEKELRDMYENLLASSMDDRKVSKAHPAFVDAIKQMSPLDAILLKKIIGSKRLRCAEVIFKLVDSSKIYTKAMPNHFVVELCDLADPFAISSSITNLERLGLLKVTETGLLNTEYESIKSHPYVVERRKLFEEFGEEFSCGLIEHAIVITNYGEQFASVCLGDDF